MTQRDAVLMLAAVLLALGVTAILLVGSLGAGAGAEGGQRVFFERRPPGPAPSVGAVRVEPGAPRGGPPFGPAVLIERGVAGAARDAAGYLLLLLAVAATTVFAREHVLASYRAAAGAWRTQLRTLGAGIAVLLLVLSATFLTSVVFLGALTGGFPGRPGLAPGAGAAPAFAIQFALQSGFVVLAVLFVLVLIPALIGFAASAWRLGDAILARRPFSRWANLVPPPLVALFGATVIYLLAQAPYIGIVIAAAAVAYALGAFVTARLESRATGLTP